MSRTRSGRPLIPTGPQFKNTMYEEAVVRSKRATGGPSIPEAEAVNPLAPQSPAKKRRKKQGQNLANMPQVCSNTLQYPRLNISQENENTAAPMQYLVPPGSEPVMERHYAFPGETYGYRRNETPPNIQVRYFDSTSKERLLIVLSAL